MNDILIRDYEPKCSWDTGDGYQHAHCSWKECRECPPHPADVPEQFTEANEWLTLERITKVCRGIIGIGEIP